METLHYTEIVANVSRFIMMLIRLSFTLFFTSHPTCIYPRTDVHCERAAKTIKK
jgi:hypothetical protein